MAFRRFNRTAEDRALDGQRVTEMNGALLGFHREAAARLIAADPEDTAAVLAAIKAWRSLPGWHWRAMAAYLVIIEDDADAVCAALGMGRTALENSIRTFPDLASFQVLLAEEAN
ncbi:Uncharacterised protein [Mycobacteroides abscessus subsp. abscessus]|uniref:hypothetical protein n=1 Tax=Mycobacteroides abscessus TaxID=36809 RepID=UPI0009A59BF9|nr:hypothetical protein [Mycobacteroides abscessus]SLJ22858.1 Uncharacterised protein [Mycobacteroides abscessus subsp. abscessus]